MQGNAPWLNISNSPGYDNQPSFLPDSSAVLFSSNRDGKQTDIYRYDIASKALTQLTKTVDSEYSPLVTPDGKGFSVIRQAAADGTQLLVRYDLDGSNARVLLEDVKPVGYHAWIDATHVALFILGAQGQPATLQIADTTTGKAEIVATGIGRSILIRPGTGTVSLHYDWTGTDGQGVGPEDDNRSASSVRADRERVRTPHGRGAADGRWRLSHGQRNRRSRGLRLAKTCWAGNHQLDLTSDGTDPARPAVANITRLAVSPNGQWLAFVAEPVRTTPGVVLTNEKERLPESSWDRR